MTPDTSIDKVTDSTAIELSLANSAKDRSSLYTLALGTFAVGTEGFMIAAILPAIANSLGTEVQAAGQLVTVFTLTYALSSPLLTVFTAALPRRQLLMLSLAGFVVTNPFGGRGVWLLVVGGCPRFARLGRGGSTCRMPKLRLAPWYRRRIAVERWLK